MRYADDIYKVARWFLHADVMTHKKLQKLLYFSYGIYLAQNNESSEKLEKFMFKNNFEAWVHGPVDPKIYSLFKDNGINLLYIEANEKFDFDKDMLDALNKTMELYGSYSADELENITHRQEPWINARKGLSLIQACSNPLSDISIYNTFKMELLNE